MNKKLRYKILKGALILVFIVCVAITAVVSLIINQQSRDTAQQAITKSLTVVQNSLVDRQTLFSESMSQMATVNKIGDVVNFLIGYKDSGLNMMRPSFEKIGNMITNTATLENLLTLGIYSNEGELINYFEEQDSRQIVMGYQFDSKYYYRTFKKGEAYDRIKYVEGSNVEGLNLSMNYAGKIPDQLSVSFVRSDKFLKMKIVVPIYADSFNEETEKIESVQVGFSVAEERLSEAFVQQMYRITGMKMNLIVNDSFSVGDFPNYTAVNISDIPKSLDTFWSIAKQKFYFNDVDIDSQTYFQGILPVYSKGKFIGGLIVLQSDEIARANTWQMVMMIGIVSLVCMILVIPVAFIAAGTLVKPLINIVEKLKDIAEGDGDLTNRLNVKSQDEIGQVAQWFNSFIVKIHTLVSDVAQNANELNESSTTLEQISKTMAKGAEQTADNSNSVSAAVEEMSISMTSVAAAMEQAAGNMGMVASATEEMSNTINEISQNTVSAKEITEDVVLKTNQASGQIQELGNAADDIGYVVGVITDISDQVNLLALNATIEAARAGDAGKGFAVVANEIKDLATQTANATNEIKEKIETMRASTGKTVEQIGDISDVANKVNEIVLMIASAVEEQSVTTQNISENIVQVTQGIDTINNNISESSAVSTKIAKDISQVTQAANEMTENSDHVDVRSKELSGLSEKLMEVVNKFKI